jgi:hypothetical protein
MFLGRKTYLPWSFVARAEASQKQDVEKLDASRRLRSELDYQNR